VLSPPISTHRLVDVGVQLERTPAESLFYVGHAGAARHAQQVVRVACGRGGNDAGGTTQRRAAATVVWWLRQPSPTLLLQLRRSRPAGALLEAGE
jgi:hypothetical protein